LNSARQLPTRLDPLWDELFPAEQARIVALLVERVEIGVNGLNVRLRTDGLAALARAFRWKRMLESGEFATIAELAEREGITVSYLTGLLRMTLLAPDLVAATRDAQRNPLCAGDRLPVASRAEGLPAKKQRARVFHYVPLRRHSDAHPSCARALSRCVRDPGHGAHHRLAIGAGLKSMPKAPDRLLVMYVGPANAVRVPSCAISVNAPLIHM